MDQERGFATIIVVRNSLWFFELKIDLRMTGFYIDQFRLDFALECRTDFVNIYFTIAIKCNAKLFFAILMHDWHIKSVFFVLV